MPARTPTVVLGFLGAGQASTDSIEALLTDLVEASGGKAKVILPATETHWNDGIEAVADLAAQKAWAIEVVTDDTSAKHKPVKGYLAAAQKQHKVENVGATVQSLTTEAGGKLVLFWEDGNDEVYDALEAAADAGTPVLDICEGLKEIELQAAPKGGESEAEAQPESGGEDEVTEEWLASKSDPEIEGMADSLGINVEQYPGWDDVRAAILEHYQAGGGGDDDETETAELPTDEEVDGWDIDALKQFAADNEVEVPARAREAGYRGAIKDFLADAREQAAALEQEEADLQLPPDGEGPLQLDPEWIEEIKADVSEVLSKMDQMLQGLGTLGQNVDKLTKTLDGKHAADPDTPPTTTVKKAATPVKAAPAKKAASPPTKAAAGAVKASPAGKASGGDSTAPPKTKGEHVMVPVLHLADYDRVSKDHAAQILELWDQRPKGRPTDRERRLHELAREQIPEVKRPPGRPRKTA